jgi:MSP (Major sperm protein) domain
MVQFNLEPSSQLYFKESSEELDQKIFKISNPSSVAITFKIKTTSPKNYCVRPNVGLILPGATQEIEGKILILYKYVILFVSSLFTTKKRQISNFGS